MTSNDELLQHILSQKPAEKIVEIPEWGKVDENGTFKPLELLCRALGVKERLEVEAKAYDEKDKSTDYRRAFYLTLMHGCVNPGTNEQFFMPEHEAAIMTHGGPVAKLAVTVLQLSGILASQQEDAKKN